MSLNPSGSVCRPACAHRYLRAESVSPFSLRDAAVKKPGSPLTRWLACTSTLFAASLALAAPEAHTPAAPAKPQAGHHGPHWAYAGTNGPRHWGGLDESFGTCRLGQTQSPIDIRDQDSVKAPLPPIRFDYKPSALRIIDNGHTIQVNYAPGSFIEVDGKRYDLLQFHFHRPSEERLNGKAYPMVAHLVHKDEAGALAVVGVLIERGARLPVMQAVFDNLPARAGTESAVPGVSIDVSALLPDNKAYYTFAGSLTTPPCSEGVTWFVLRHPAHLSGAQIAQFGRRYPMNARPVQPLNGRQVRASE
jgi:carbonic anhydrase